MKIFVGEGQQSVENPSLMVSIGWLVFTDKIKKKRIKGSKPPMWLVTVPGQTFPGVPLTIEFEVETNELGEFGLDNHGYQDWDLLGFVHDGTDTFETIQAMNEDEYPFYPKGGLGNVAAVVTAVVAAMDTEAHTS